MLEELKTFIKVIECKSFNKASEELFISPTAIMKQINNLEDLYETKLFNRSPKGLTLTPDGELLEKYARKILDLQDQSIREIYKNKTSDNIIRVGTSTLYPCSNFFRIWPLIENAYPELKLEIIPFEDNSEKMLDIIDEIGKSIDILIGVTDSPKMLKRISFLPLKNVRFTLEIPYNNPLSKNNEISLKDLNNQTMVMVKSGDSPENSRLREYIAKNNINIKIIDAPHYYDLSVFNYAYKNGYLLKSLECWKDIFPPLKTVLIKENFKIKYGLLYEKNPSSKIRKVIELISENIDGIDII